MTTYSTDTQVTMRCPAVVAALSGINRSNAAATGATPTQSISTLSLADYRAEAQRQLLQALLARGIPSADITRPDDLVEPEVCLTVALVFEAATVARVQPTAGLSKADLYESQGAFWRGLYDSAISTATPIDNVKSDGPTFRWDRG